MEKLCEDQVEENECLECPTLEEPLWSKQWVIRIEMGIWEIWGVSGDWSRGSGGGEGVVSGFLGKVGSEEGNWWMLAVTLKVKDGWERKAFSRAMLRKFRMSSRVSGEELGREIWGKFVSRICYLRLKCEGRVTPTKYNMWTTTIGTFTCCAGQSERSWPRWAQKRKANWSGGEGRYGLTWQGSPPM